MGIVSVFVFGALIVCLVIARRQVKKFANEEDDEGLKIGMTWVSRFLWFCTAVCLLWIMDSYIVKIPNPLAPPSAGNELPKESPEPPEPQPPEIKSVPVGPDMKAVKDEHQQQLKEFEGK